MPHDKIPLTAGKESIIYPEKIYLFKGSKLRFENIIGNKVRFLVLDGPLKNESQFESIEFHMAGEYHMVVPFNLDEAGITENTPRTPK